MDIGEIKDISNYLGETDFICKSCGSISELEDVNVIESTWKNKKVHYGAHCPECAAFIRWMPTSKTERIWWKNDMVEIASMDTGLIMWLLNHGKGNIRQQKFMRKLLLERLVAPEDIPDAPQITKLEELSLKANRELDESMEKYKNLIIEFQKKIIDNFGSADSIQMSVWEGYIKAWKRKLENLKKK